MMSIKTIKSAPGAASYYANYYGQGEFSKWFGKGSNLHGVWDSKMIESWNMSYIELALNANNLNKQQIDAINKGNIIDWTYESQNLAKNVYNSANKGEKLSYKYSYDHFGLVRSQLQKAGIRLAKILNDIYG